MLETAANLGIQTLEFGGGGWSSAPHLDLNTLLGSEAERANFLAKIRAHGLEISTLNCSGNQLAPGQRGRAHDQVVRGTLKLAGLLGVRRIVMMAGLPGRPGDQNPNWITTAWPPEVQGILSYQSEDVALPYWRDLPIEPAFSYLGHSKGDDTDPCPQGLRLEHVGIASSFWIMFIRCSLQMLAALGLHRSIDHDPDYLWQNLQP